MICKLKLRFDKIYADYRCFLWTVVIVQALSLIIGVTITIIDTYSDAVLTFESELSDGLYIIYEVSYEIVAFIVPIFT